jgi:hypothetical protein
MTLCDSGRASMAYFYFDFKDIDKQSSRTCFLPFSSSFQLGPIPVVISSPDYTLHTTVEFGSPTIVLWWNA